MTLASFPRMAVPMVLAAAPFLAVLYGAARLAQVPMTKAMLVGGGIAVLVGGAVAVLSRALPNTHYGPAIIGFFVADLLVATGAFVLVLAALVVLGRRLAAHGG